MKFLSLALLPLLAATVVDAACSPHNFLVNYGEDPGQMVVTWTSKCATRDSVIRYGIGSLTHTLKVPQFSNYTTIGYKSPYFYHAVLDDLQLDTTYMYSVGGPTTGYSPVFTFTSNPGVGPNVKVGELAFAVVGDLGDTLNSFQTVKHISENERLNSLILVGDLSYADGTQPVWDSWTEYISEVARSMPWMFIPGNHEAEWITHENQFVAYDTRFRMPLANGKRRRFYSFEVGPVHWLMTSTYEDFSPGSEQYEFILQDLASVDRTKTPWLFFTSHAPWFCSNQRHFMAPEPQLMRETFDKYLKQYKVDAAFFGHVHAYERNNRVHDFAYDPEAPFHITVGGGGNHEGLEPNWHPTPDYSEFRMASYGYGEIQIVNSTCAKWIYHKNDQMYMVSVDETYFCKE